MQEVLAFVSVVSARLRGRLYKHEVLGVLIIDPNQEARLWLGRLIGHPALALRFGLAGAHYVHALHGQSRIREQWAALFLELVRR